MRPSTKVALAVMIGILIGDSPAAGQPKLQVGSGNQRIVTASSLHVEEWEMEDNSTLIIDTGIETWSIFARRATFGSGVRILGVGADGTAGSGSSQNGKNGSECEDGDPGAPGDEGTPGKPGVQIHIKAGLVKVGSVLIDTSGGRGGDGERGGNGGRGGRASCGEICSGQEGGNGGRGGEAGDGGSSGSVRVEYWIADKQPIVVGYTPRSDDDPTDLERGLRVRAEPGAPGTPGQGGLGGPGGSGRRCLFNTVRRGAGSNGARGPTGNSGLAGHAGDVQFIVIPAQ